ncbi:MAG: tripartite tricarboxylate transporter substrate binding protein [Thermodesulfobacteriota bacterium]
MLTPGTNRKPAPTARRLPCALLIAIGMLIAVPQGAWADDYPSKPIRIIVPLAAGGTGDTMARLLAEGMAGDAGRRIIVENRPGSGGTIGTDFVAKSPPDGYTVVLVGTSHCMNATLQKLPYDPIRDFSPVALIANTPSVLIVHPSVAAQSVPELVALSRQRPGAINYGSAGNGSTPHLHAELFKIMTGADMVHVPYKGSTPARVAVMSGEVQVMFDGLLPSLSLIKEGKVRALGVTNARRTGIAPDIPTIAEAGVPGYVADSWYALLAPVKTPKPVVDRLRAMVQTALQSGATKARLVNLGADPGSGTPDDLLKLLQSEIPKWGKVIREAKITVH